MKPEDVQSLKVSRTDLVKTCATQLLEELEEERKRLDAAVATTRRVFDEFVVSVCMRSNSRFIKDCVEHCNGRSKRLSHKVCADLRPGQPIPDHALVIVQDGTDYDYNFRVQLGVPMEGEVLGSAKAHIETEQQRREAMAQRTRVSDMDTKAREKLLKDALDSTAEGAEALDALKRMRAAIKKQL